MASTMISDAASASPASRLTGRMRRLPAVRGEWRLPVGSASLESMQAAQPALRRGRKTRSGRRPSFSRSALAAPVFGGFP